MFSHNLRKSLFDREYNGNARQRYSVASMEPLDYAKESRLMLDRISALSA